MFVHPIFKLPEKERGQSLMEYALVLVLVAVVIVAILTLFGETLQETYCRTVYTLQLDSGGDLSSSCTKPIIVTQVNTVTSSVLNLEAQVHDPDGGTIVKVEFYIDDVYIRTEGAYRYCLGAGDANCRDQNISGLAAGRHTVTMIAYDNQGNVGTLNYSFTK